jgi:hypothetical protein
VLRQWKIKNGSYSSTGNASISDYHHSIELEEVETLNLTSLNIRDLVISPYSYNETFDGDALIIEAKVVLSESQYTQLKDIMKVVGYFPVVRHGIDERPRDMRFGQMRWSKLDNGVKHELIIVEKNYDTKKEQFDLFNPEMYSMQDMIAENKETIEALIDVLLSKGLLAGC